MPDPRRFERDGSVVQADDGYMDRPGIDMISGQRADHRFAFRFAISILSISLAKTQIAILTPLHFSIRVEQFQHNLAYKKSAAS
ncbi:hypothetical protein [Sphingobium sp. HWE2-09]|uniref:hypothetical protein n=1 Tax=Sphingobium sp. HWE2-09 TaxID=3108390 RepID=UPI002DCD1EEA|nr:hypothetical protein [Sphingobium sp. HWE2-09]